MTRTAKRIRLHHSRPAWQLAVLLLAALVFLPSIPLAQSAPSTPSAVTVTRADGTLTATWPAVSGATKYHVTYTSNNKQSWSLAALDHTTTSITISGDNAKTYIVGVRAGNDDDWSDWRDSAPAGPYTPPAPGPVASVTVTRADGTLTATWPAVSGATKYHVTYTSNNKQSWSLAALSHTTTSLTINAADNAKTYVVGVRAGNDDDWSDWRDSPASGPYTPPGLIVQDANGNPITALAVPEGGEASYQVKLATQPTEDVEVCIGLSVQPDNDTDITFKGQASDVVALKLTFTPENWNTAQTATLVAAEDNDDVNGARAVVNDARDYYSGKVDLTATEVDNDQLTVTATRGNDGDTAGVSWTAYTGDDFEYYRVIVCNASQYNGSSCSGTVFRSDAIHDATSTGPVTVPGLSAGTGYGIILQVWRNGSALKRHATLPALDVPGAPANLAVEPGTGYLDIEWDAVTDATGYDVQASIGGSNWTTAFSNTANTSVQYTTDDADDIDHVRVRARNANGGGPWATKTRGVPPIDWYANGGMADASDGASANSGPPAAPASVSVTRTTWRLIYAQLNVSWKKVADADTYNVVCSFTNGWSWLRCGSVNAEQGGSADQKLEIRSYGPNWWERLEPGKTYVVAVQAVDGGQAGAWTNSAAIGPLFGNFIDMQVTRADGSITLSWKANPSAAEYLIDCAVEGESYTRCANPTVQDANAARHSVTISSWTAGGSNYSINNTKTYAVNITVKNQWGTAAEWGFAPLIHPLSLTVSDVRDTKATLTIAGHTYTWYYRASTGPDATCRGPVAAGTSSQGLDGLTPGASYTYSAYRNSTCSTLLATASSFSTSDLTASSVAGTTATITLANYAGSWWYKADSGPDLTCSGEQTGTSVDLTGLTRGAPYTYRAYTDSTCVTTASAGTADEIASVSFTTIAVTLTVTNVTNATATLTLANHSGDWYYQHAGQGALCQGPVVGNSVNLASLTAGTTYIYSAYSDTSCSTSIATAAQFTTGHHVTNLNSVKNGDSNIYDKLQQAVAFTTGANAGGYTLNGITLPLRQKIPGGSPTLALHAMAGNAVYGTGSAPSATPLANATLSGTAPTSDAWADTTYTCSGAGCSLSANTTYFVVTTFSGTGIYAWAYTETNSESTYPSDSGWDIKFGHYKHTDTAETRPWRSFGDWHPIRIDFTTKTVGTGSAQTAPVVVATATVRGTTSPLDPAGAAAQAANRADNPANTHGGNGWGEAATASATRSPGYVTNLASAQSGDSDVDATQRQAVAFTTGPNPGGYTLKSFTAALRKVSGNADLMLTLHAMASAAYGDDSQPAPTVLATLSGSAPASGAYTDVTYTCSGFGCALEPDTTYFVVAESSGNGAYAWAYVASANLYTESTLPSDSGWTLGASYYAQEGEAWASFGDWHHARLDFETHPVLSVGNLAEAPHPDACFPSGDATCAVGFTTGSAPGGYTLRALTARFEDADDPDGMLGDLVVTLHADNAGLPGQSLATLNGDNPTEAGDYTYTCSGAGCALAPDTTYFVQVSATAGAYLSEAYAWSATLSDHQTPIPAGNGWTLANGTTAYRSTWQTYPDVGLLEIVATR